jgi:hypothetical protein
MFGEEFQRFQKLLLPSENNGSCKIFINPFANLTFSQLALFFAAISSVFFRWIEV